MPDYDKGKICYLEIPCADVETSANFYHTVFGWELGRRGDGSVSFNDSVGQVSGTWVPGLAPAREVGILIHIMVLDMDASLAAVLAQGGEVVQGVGAHLPEITARIRDPYGNLFGLYQHGGR